MTTAEAPNRTTSTSPTGASPMGVGLLTGVTVVEIAHPITEYAGVVLAGLGADVWLVEPPEGSATRARHPYVDGASPSRRSVPFLARNVGKRSVVIDPANPADERSLVALLAAADVVIEHQDSPFAASTAAAARPLVRVTDGRNVGASSVVAFTASGSISSSGWAHQPPCNAPSWLALDATGTYVAMLALTLVRDERVHGRLHEATVEHMEAGIAGLTNWTRTLFSYGTQSAGQGAITKRDGSGPFPVLPCKDGAVRVIAATPKQWEALIELLDRPEVLLDPIWLDFQYRNDSYDVIFLVASEILRDRLVDEVFQRGQALGLPITPALTVAEVLRDEHVAARELFTPVEDPEVGAVRMLRAPVTLRAEDLQIALPTAPALDQHRDQLAQLPARTRPTGSRPDGRSLPFAGLRVLSFCVGAVLPEATSFLAQLGAQVIKVESHAGLDFFRRLGGASGNDVNASPTFNQANLSVESCCVDASTERGRAVLRDLVAHCDVVMENMRASVMRKFVMDHESVHAINPAVVYLSSQGLGAGPYEEFTTYGPNLQSFAGMTSIWAHPDDPYPVGSVLSYPDHLGGKQAAIAVLAALMRRDETGLGCYLECPQFEVCLWSIADKFVQEQLLPGSVRPLGNRSLDAAPHGCFPCAGDDQWCALSVDDDDAWLRLVDLLEAPALRDPAYATAAGRLAAVDDVEAAVRLWTSQRSSADNVGLLRDRGIAASTIIDGRSQSQDQALHDSGFYAAIPHPVCGVRYATGQPFLIDGHRPSLRRAPLMGEHTEEVLLDIVGVDPLDLSRWVADGEVGT